MADPSVDPNLVPVSDETHQAAKIYLGVTVTLLTVALSTLIARIAFKLRSSARFGLDDYFIIVGFILASVDWAVYTVAIAWGADSSLKFTTAAQAQETIKLGVIAIPIWGFSIGFIKLSVACLLLRFQTSRPWRLFLYFLIFLIAFVTIGSSLVAIMQCIPLAAIWDPTHHLNAKCVGPNRIKYVSNFVGGFSIATDLVLSLFPLTFLLKLRRPRVEKLLISILMAVGLSASAASITKAVYIQKWVNDPDGMFFGFTISTLGITEMLIGSIAACLPYLKTTVQGVLMRCGVDFSLGFEEEMPSFVVQVERTQANRERENHAFEEVGQEGTKSSKLSSSESSDKSLSTGPERGRQ